MVQAIIKIEDETNKILNLIKVKYGLKDKSQAINKMAQEYEEFILEPQLKTSYVEKMRKIQKEKTVSIDDFNKHFGVQ